MRDERSTRLYMQAGMECVALVTGDFVRTGGMDATPTTNAISSMTVMCACRPTRRDGSTRCVSGTRLDLVTFGSYWHAVASDDGSERHLAADTAIGESPRFPRS